MSHKHIIFLIPWVVLLLAACRPQAAPFAPPIPTPVAGATDEIVVASDADAAATAVLTGLLNDFTNKTGINVRLLPAGPGQVLDMAASGDVDVVLTGDRATAERFISEGHTPAVGQLEPILLKRYFVLPVLPTSERKLNFGGATAFITWLGGADIQQQIQQLSR